MGVFDLFLLLFGINYRFIGNAPILEVLSRGKWISKGLGRVEGYLERYAHFHHFLVQNRFLWQYQFL